MTRKAMRLEGSGTPPYGLSTDCTLYSANLCSGWIWVFNDVEGAVWGSVMSPQDCPGGCPTGGAVTEITLYGRCSTTPGSIDGIGVSTVDGVGCRTSLLYASGPMTMTHCVSGDRWTIIQTPLVGLGGNPFAVTITWGPQPTPGTSNPQLATDNGIANLYCMQNPSAIGVFPGCATSSWSCARWALPPQRTFIYVTDINGDGVLDDLCAIYGAPYPLSFPYVGSYGYMPNNLIISVGLDCRSPTATESTTWGRLKTFMEGGARSPR